MTMSLLLEAASGSTLPRGYLPGRSRRSRERLGGGPVGGTVDVDFESSRHVHVTRPIEFVAAEFCHCVSFGVEKVVVNWLLVPAGTIVVGSNSAVGSMTA